MDANANPYKPGGGIRPAALIGRDDELETFSVLLARLQAGHGEQCLMVSGLRGVGKTVLLNAYEDLALDHGWQVALVEAGSGLSLAEMIADWARACLIGLSPSKSLLDRARDRLKSLQNYSMSVSSTGDVTFTLSSSDQAATTLGSDLPLLFLELGALAAEKNSGAVLLLDEAHCLDPEELRPLLGALHRVAQKGLPVTFVCAGLPQLPILAVKAKSYAERLFDFSSIGRLNEAEAIAAVVEPAKQHGVEWADDAVVKVCELSDGYPFFIQQYAKYAWLRADGSPISLEDVQAGAALALDKLDTGFFDVRLNRTSRIERAYLRAMASTPSPHLTTQIASSLSGSTSRWSRVREQLIMKGLIYSSDRGVVAFTVPHFAEYLQRHPELGDN